MRDQIISLYRTYLGREPSDAEIASHEGNPNGIQGVDAAIKGSGEYADRLRAGTSSSAVTQPGQSQIDANPRDAMIARDQQQWFNRLRAKAIELGFADPDRAAQEELQGVINAASYAQNAGQDPAQYLTAAEQRLTARGANNRGPAATPGPTGGGSSSGGGTAGAASGSWFAQAGAPVSGAPQSIQPFTRTFTAPTMDDVTKSEPFRFRLGEALQAIERGGLAKGTFGTNQTWKALQEQASGMAGDEYARQYDRKLGEFLTERDIWNQNEQNRFGSQRTNRMDDRGIFEDDRNFSRGVFESDRGFGRLLNRDARSDFESDRGFGRQIDLDTWGRGLDVWNLNRTDRQDAFNNDITLQDLLQRYRPRPTA